jgi:hypothetical protein
MFCTDLPHVWPAGRSGRSGPPIGKELRPTTEGRDVRPCGRNGLRLVAYTRTNLPRAAFLNRASLPFLPVSRSMAE